MLSIELIFANLKQIPALSCRVVLLDSASLVFEEFLQKRYAQFSMTIFLNAPVFDLYWVTKEFVTSFSVKTVCFVYYTPVKCRRKTIILF